MSGKEAVNTRDMIAGANDWKTTQTLYWMGKPMSRESEEYQIYADELFWAAFRNSLYKENLAQTGDKVLIHSMGGNNPKDTTFTRDEFENRLNCLKELL